MLFAPPAFSFIRQLGIYAAFSNAAVLLIWLWQQKIYRAFYPHNEKRGGNTIKKEKEVNILNLTPEEYKKVSQKYSRNSPLLKDCTMAFLIGGLICCIGQALTTLYMYWGLEQEVASAVTSVSLVFLSALLTGFNEMCIRDSLRCLLLLALESHCFAVLKSALVSAVGLNSH